MAFELTLHVAMPWQELAGLGRFAGDLAAEWKGRLEGRDPDSGVLEATWFLEDLAKLAHRRALDVPGSVPGLVVWGIVGNYTKVDAFVEGLQPLWTEAIRRDPDAQPLIWSEAEEPESITARELRSVRVEEGASQSIACRELRLGIGWRVVAPSEAELGGPVPVSVEADVLHVAMDIGWHTLVARAAKALLPAAEGMSEPVRQCLCDMTKRRGGTSGVKGGMSLWAHVAPGIDASAFVRELEPLWRQLGRDCRGSILVAHQRRRQAMGCFVIHAPDPILYEDSMGFSGRAVAPVEEGTLWMRHVWLPCGVFRVD